MAIKEQRKIFRKGGKTFYYSSLFLPKDVRNKVTILYSFLRTVDDLVDEKPIDPQKYLDFKKEYLTANNTGSSDNFLIDSFVKLKKSEGFQDEWIDALFKSMEMDLYGRKYQTIEDTIEYTYGVAEVVGFMMAKVLKLSPKAMEAAQLFGRAGQYSNMIRDIAEDIELGRIYMPHEDLDKFGLKSLKFSHTNKSKENFKKFINFQIDRHDTWMHEAEAGYKYIPRKYRITVKTAGDLYNKWTMNIIRKNPFVIYEKSVKPSKSKILSTGLKNLILAN